MIKHNAAYWSVKVVDLMFLCSNLPDEDVTYYLGTRYYFLSGIIRHAAIQFSNSKIPNFRLCDEKWIVKVGMLNSRFS